jgi:hypothetical protein
VFPKSAYNDSSRSRIERGGSSWKSAVQHRTTLGLADNQPSKEHIVGKYALAWLLGVPGIVLVLIYFFMH